MTKISPFLISKFTELDLFLASLFFYEATLCYPILVFEATWKCQNYAYTCVGPRATRNALSAARMCSGTIRFMRFRAALSRMCLPILVVPGNQPSQLVARSCSRWISCSRMIHYSRSI